MKIDIDRALKDEEYARNIPVDEEGNLYDDYIFIFSVIYASNIPLDKWYEKFKNDDRLFGKILSFAQVDHCLNWDEAIKEEIDSCGLCEFENDNGFNGVLKSREFVQANITPFMLKKLIDNDKITNGDILEVFKSIIKTNNRD